MVITLLGFTVVELGLEPVLGWCVILAIYSDSIPFDGQVCKRVLAVGVGIETRVSGMSVGAGMEAETWGTEATK